MIKSGIVSITFRNLSPEKIVALAEKAELSAIEWGGDVHVPHGDTEAARRTEQMTRDAGLEAAAYGSYYRAAESEKKGLLFADVLKTAEALGAPLIRVWAGSRNPEDADAGYREAVGTDINRIAEMAAGSGIRIACEFHEGTLTKTAESAAALIEETDHDNLSLLWQPPHRISSAQRSESLQRVMPYLENIHVFHWTDEDGVRQRRPLSEGETEWLRDLRAVSGSGTNHYALLEFVQDDDPECFLRDAAVLREWIARVQNS